jgi:uncharacterized protein (TIGR02231 family)
LIDFSKTQIPKEIITSFPSMEDLAKTLTFLSSNFERISEQRQSIDASLTEIEKEIRVVEEKLGAIRGPVKRAIKVLEILFKAEKDQKVRIEADYLVKNATWEPLYKVSVPLTLSEVHLTMFSRIQQRTGENWDQVVLSISNVIPMSGVQLPSLSSWLLDIPQPLTDMRMKAGGLAKQKAFIGATEGEEHFGIPEEEADFAIALKKEMPLSFEYRIAQPIDIESRDKETILPLFTKEMQGDFYYYAVPKQSVLTFLVCKAKADKELLSGPVNVYLGGRYIGKTYLGEKRPGEEFFLNLGADREVKVKREKFKDKIKETYFGKIQRGTIVREMAYKITTENLKSRSITLKLLENISISGTDKIEIKDTRLSPEPSERNYQGREGVMLWEYKLDPEEKREVSIKFVVTYPKDESPMGF